MRERERRDLGAYKPPLEGGDVDGAVPDAEDERVARRLIIHQTVAIRPCGYRPPRAVAGDALLHFLSPLRTREVKRR